MLLGFCTFSNYKTLKNLVRSLQATIGHLLKKSVTTPLPFQHQRKKTSFEFLLFEFDHFCHLKMAFALWFKHKKNESLSKATIHFSLVEKFNWHKFVFDLLTFRSILHSDETVRIIQQHIADKFIFTEKNCKFNWWMNFLQISLFLLIQVMIITQLLLMAISLYKCFSCMRREIEIPYPLSLWLLLGYLKFTYVAKTFSKFASWITLPLLQCLSTTFKSTLTSSTLRMEWRSKFHLLHKFLLILFWNKIIKRLLNRIDDYLLILKSQQVSILMMMGVFDDPIDVQQIQTPINWQSERKHKTRTIIWINVQSHIRVCLFLIISIHKLLCWR